MRNLFVIVKFLLHAIIEEDCTHYAYKICYVLTGNKVFVIKRIKWAMISV